MKTREVIWGVVTLAVAIAAVLLAFCADTTGADIDAANITFYGPWAGGALGNYKYAAAGNGQAWCDWSFNDLAPGFYEVTTTYVPHGNRATNARYRVITTGYAASFATVDQRKGTEATLGTITVKTGGAVTIRLTNQADGYVIAQGIRLRSLEPTGTATAWWCRDKGEGVDPEAWYRLIVGDEPPTFGERWLIWYPAAGGTIAYQGPNAIAGLPELEPGGGPVRCEVLVRVAE